LHQAGTAAKRQRDLAAGSGKIMENNERYPGKGLGEAGGP